MPTGSSDQVRLGEKLGYGVGDLASGLMLNFFGFFLRVTHKRQMTHYLLYFNAWCNYLGIVAQSLNEILVSPFFSPLR